MSALGRRCGGTARPRPAADLLPPYRPTAQARDRDRTGDLILTKDALYRLSYASDDVSAACDFLRFEAGDGTRTRDPQLGRLMLYQLSYTRERPAPVSMVGVGFEPT